MSRKIVTLSIDSEVWVSFRKKLAVKEGLDKGKISEKVEELIKWYVKSTET